MRDRLVQLTVVGQKFGHINQHFHVPRMHSKCGGQKRAFIFPGRKEKEAVRKKLERKGFAGVPDGLTRRAALGAS